VVITSREIHHVLAIMVFANNKYKRFWRVLDERGHGMMQDTNKRNFKEKWMVMHNAQLQANEYPQLML